jgi:thymidylate synthase (FAD)
MNIQNVGEGKVILLSGGGKIFTDIAARFVGSERSLEYILASEYDKNIVKNIINSGHKAATEFDYFIFGIEGYSRITEVQLVRKRIASYMVKSGRLEKYGRRKFSMVIPDSIMDIEIQVYINGTKIKINTSDILNIIESWYDEGIEHGIAEEDLRYLKPQATEFKALIGMNAHSLLDWFQIRCCMNAQNEIRDMANKMLSICKGVAPDLFDLAGASCKNLGYCPENKRQNKNCLGKVCTKDEALIILNKNWSRDIKIIH